MKRALFLFCLCVAARAQPQSSDASVIQALLSEVHQLRIALERSNAIGPRIQLAVERVKLQQDHVARIAAQLEGVRHDLEGRQSEGARLADSIKNMESDISQAADPLERKNLSNNLRDLKTMVEQGQKLEQALRGREAELSSRLQSEQATLDGLNDRLDQIERALNAVPIQ